MEQDYTSIDLRELFGLVRRNVFKLILAALWGVVLALAVLVLVVPTYYQATATLVVNSGTPQETVTGEQLNTARQLADTYAVLLTNDSLLGEVIRTHGLDDTVRSLRKRMDAQAVDDTQVMRVTVKDEDPDTALAVLTTIVERAPEVLAGAAQPGGVAVVSPPWVDGKPVSPNLLAGLALGAGLGLLAALLILMARRLLTSRFFTEEDVTQHLRLPVLGDIPAAGRRCEEDGEAAREAFSFLRAALRGLPQKGSCRRLVVTSAVPGEGKSMVCAGLARSFASEERVLLLDANPRHKPTDEESGREAGLADLLEGRCAFNGCAECVSEDGYWRLSATEPAPELTERLDSRRMTDFLASLEGGFEQVIMDTGAVLTAADAAVLGGHADAVLLVIRRKRGATFQQAQQAVRRLETSGAVVAGIVLTGGEAREAERRNRIAQRQHGKH